MMRAPVRNAVIGIRLTGAGLDKAREWCGQAFSRLGNVPVLWSFPCLNRGTGPFADGLRGRLESGRDALAPMGYAGAVHPALSMEELGFELSWTLSNPWSTGVKDAFGAAARALAPWVPDFRRPQAVKAYAEAGFTKICVQWTGAAGPCRKGALTLIPYTLLIPVRGSPAELAKTLFRTIGKKRDAFLMVDLSPCGSADVLIPYLDALLGFLSGAGYAVTPPETLLGRKGQEATGPLPESWAEVPAQRLRQNLAAASSIQRKKRIRHEDFRRALELLSERGLSADVPVEKTGRRAGPEEKTLVAHMQGEVTLAGPEFDARMSGGRFLGLSRRGKPLTPAVAASSYLTIAGRTHPFKSRSAISFEGDGGTGLRDDLLLDARGYAGRMSVEYEFREDSPELLVTTTVHYPAFPGLQSVDAVAPLAFYAAELGPEEKAEVSAVLADEPAVKYSLTEADGWKAVPGMSWQIKTAWGGISLHAFDGREKVRGLCFLRVVKARGRRYVEINPSGSPQPVPAALLEGRTETVMTLIGLSKPRPKGGS